MGYSSLSEFNYGSELTLIYLAKEFQKYYNVFIFSSNNTSNEDTLINDLKYVSGAKFEEYASKLSPDVLIVSRYINVFLYNTVVSIPNIYLWLHDISFQSSFQGLSLPKNGKNIYKNLEHKINGVVVLTESHKKLIKHLYDIPDSKLHVVNHGIHLSSMSQQPARNKFKFVWTSYPNRGLDLLLTIFPQIHTEFPQAELFIYRDRSTFSAEQLQRINAHSSFIHAPGFVSNDIIKKELQTSGIWLYTTNFVETFCLSALEAQEAGCLCITSNIGSLPEIVGNRGIILEDVQYGSPEYIDKVLKHVRIFFKTDLYAHKIQRAQEWAKQQTWDKTCKRWLQIFGDPNPPLKEELKTVRVFTDWEAPDFVVNFFKKMSKNNDGKWNDMKLLPSTENFSDFDCVLNRPLVPLKQDKDKTIVFMMEPVSAEFQFSIPPEWSAPPSTSVKYFSNHNTEWHLSWTYSQFLSQDVVKDETKTLSAIVSSKCFLQGHRLRVSLMKYLDEHLNFTPFDIYGSNIFSNHFVSALPPRVKDNGIFPYKYTMNFENSQVEGYFTEKIVDAILGECLCFYWGCPNLSQYIDPQAYIVLDITNHQQSLEIIRESIANNEWEKRIEIIRREKMRILNHHNMFPRLYKIITNNTVPAIPMFVLSTDNAKWLLVRAQLLHHGFDMFERRKEIFYDHDLVLVADDNIQLVDGFAQKWTNLYAKIKEDNTWSVMIIGEGLSCVRKRDVGEFLKNETCLSRSFFHFIDHVVYINLEKRSDRRAEMERDVLTKFASVKIHRLQAVEDLDEGRVGCTKSHIQVLEMAIAGKWKNVLVFEDDVMFQNFEENHRKLETLVNEPFDVLMLGTYCSTIDEKTLRVTKSFGLHAYLVNGSYFETLLNNFKTGLEKLIETKDFPNFAADTFIVKLQERDNWRAMKPSMCFQRPGFSDNEKKNTDYVHLYA